jgi:hypothetical protein
MQFALEVAVLKCFFLKYSQGILGVNMILLTPKGSKSMKGIIGSLGGLP